RSSCRARVPGSPRHPSAVQAIPASGRDAAQARRRCGTTTTYAWQILGKQRPLERRGGAIQPHRSLDLREQPGRNGLAIGREDGLQVLVGLHFRDEAIAVAIDLREVDARRDGREFGTRYAAVVVAVGLAERGITALAFAALAFCGGVVGLGHVALRQRLRSEGRAADDESTQREGEHAGGIASVETGHLHFSRGDRGGKDRVVCVAVAAQFEKREDDQERTRSRITTMRAGGGCGGPTCSLRGAARR